jgi:hypothetical protein
MGEWQEVVVGLLRNRHVVQKPPVWDRPRHMGVVAASSKKYLIG